MSYVFEVIIERAPDKDGVIVQDFQYLEADAENFPGVVRHAEEQLIGFDDVLVSVRRTVPICGRVAQPHPEKQEETK